MELLRAICWLCLVLSVQCACPNGMPIVSLQLKWLQQTQFAGYFAAQAQGFYYDECLTLNIRPGGPAIIVEDEVLHGRAQFGVTWHALAMVALNANQNVTVVAQMFQRVGKRLVTHADSNIRTPRDFKGKKVCARGYGSEPDWRAVFARYNLTWDSDKTPGVTDPLNNEVDVVAEYSLAQLTSRQCDVSAVQIYNEYAQLMLTEKTPGVLYRPEDFHWLLGGQSMLEDMIIASTDWLEVPKNQDIAIRFLRASFRGWIYARANPKETVNMFADKTALQTWQMNEVNSLTWPAPMGIGIVSDELLQESAQIAANFGLTSREWNVSEFYRSDLALAAHQGIEKEDVYGLNFKPETMAFCMGNRGVGEICDLSVEAATSFVSVSSTIGVVMIVVTLVGLLIAGVCAALLIYWRGEKVIRSASLPFSLLMCIGAIIGLISNFFHLDRPVDGTCHARVWLLGLGFITFFGNFLVKVWRIHAIFSGKVLFKIKVPPDSRLYFWFGVLCLIQIILLGLYSGVGSPTAARVVHVHDYTQYDTMCVSDQSDVWNLLFALYAACMLIYGVYLAVQVRHIQSLYNEAKLLGASIYNVLFVAVVCGPILLFLDMPPTSVALVTSLANVAMFSGGLAIVFFPRFFVVLGSPRFPASETGTRQSRSNNSHSMDEMLKFQDKEQLLASKAQALDLKEQATAAIKAIDAELDRRSHGLCAHSPRSHSQRLTATERGEHGKRADTQNSQNNSRVDSQNGEEKPQNSRAEKLEEPAKEDPLV